jgi:putative PIG3 family NAD(P)H quinone oxidoreductase
MRAVIYTAAGDPSVIALGDRPDPVAGAGEVIVRVRASALNRADVLQRQGRYPPPPGAPADIPGIEYAGEIAALGAGVTGWNVGDRVFGLADGGAHAELVKVHATHLARVPATLDWSDAGAVPEAFITAHDALVTQGGLARGARAIVTACGSGVGTAALQIIRAVGAHGFGTTRSADKLERAKLLGADSGAVLTTDLAPLAEGVKAWSGGAGADVACDLIGGPYVGACVSSMALKGRVIVVGLLAGASVPLDLGLLLRKRLTVRGTVLRSRDVAEKASATAAFARDVLPWLAGGAVRPIVHQVFPFAAIADAHRAMEAGEPFGKLVLTW